MTPYASPRVPASFTGTNLVTSLVTSIAMAASLACGAAHAQKLDEVVRKVLPGHPKLEEQRQSINAALTDVEVARTAWNTRLQLDGGIGHQHLVGPAVGSSSVLTPALRLRKLLTDGGRTDGEIDIRNLRVTQDRAAFRVAEEDLALSIAEAYVQVARAKEAITLTQNWIEGLKGVENLTREIQKIDRGRQMDVAQAASRTAQADAQLASRRAALAEAARQLNEIAGSSVWTEAPVSLVTRPEVSPAGQLDEATLAAHPRVLAADAASRVARQQIVIDSLYDRPRIDMEIFASGGQDATGRSRFLNAVGAQLVGSHTLFDGGGGAATVKASGFRLAQADAAVSTARLDVRTGYARWAGAEENRAARLRSFENAYAEAVNLRSLMSEQFKAGRRPILDLLSQESEIYTAATGISQERYDAALNQIHLAYAAGKLLESLNVPSNVPTGAPAP